MAVPHTKSLGRTVKHILFFGLVGVLTLFALTGCENNLLDVLGRDVFFRNVVDPFSIRVDFENTSSLNVSADTPVYLQLYGLVNGVLEGEIKRVVVGPIVSNSETIIITKSQLDQVGSNFNGYLLSYVFNIHPDDFDGVENYEEKSKLFTRNVSGFTPDFRGIYNGLKPGYFSYNFFSGLARNSDGSLPPDNTDLSRTPLLIANSSIVARGNRYELSINNPLILPDQYEPDNNLMNIFTNKISDWLVVGEIQNRTIHWRDSDIIVFKPSSDGPFTFTFNIDTSDSLFEDPELEALIPSFNNFIDSYQSFALSSSLYEYDNVGLTNETPVSGSSLVLNSRNSKVGSFTTGTLNPDKVYALYISGYIDNSLEFRSIAKYSVKVD